jgi:hypothetical protein
MKLFTPYVENFIEGGENNSRIIVALVRNNLGYGMFNLPLIHNRVCRNDIREFGEPHSWFCNNKNQVEFYDQLKSVYGQEDLEICTDSEILRILLIGVFKFDSQYVGLMKQWKP